MGAAFQKSDAAGVGKPAPMRHDSAFRARRACDRPDGFGRYRTTVAAQKIADVLHSVYAQLRFRPVDIDASTFCIGGDILLVRRELNRLSLSLIGITKACESNFLGNGKRFASGTVRTASH